ncbi:cation:proton antiporter [Geminicoccus roseus]|uniref:cation:proton antiporter n=1 Tax=Geminicoccus roseus TaxID=404900 RepID=UPI0003FE4EEA|nr:sodium:proton antiporter [Geminicoccus roseus]
MLSLFQLIAALLTVTAVFAYINHRVLRLPASIGLLVMGLGASLLLIGIDLLFPRTQLYAALAGTIRQIDFYDTVMNGMLAFLLFAGALHVDLGRLRNRALGVGLLATIGVVMSMFLVATGLWLAAGLLGLELGFAWALVFGALIAPTDPVAVLSTLKAVNVPHALETDMAGESLFNDGIGVVLFTIALQAALGSGDDSFEAAHLAELVLVEAGGGAVLGLVAGFIAYRGLRGIDDYSIEVMISVALVTGTYALATALHMSGPIAVVVAGVLIGNRGAERAMSDTTKQYVFGFWTLIDDILNAVLFLLIGLEVLVVQFTPSFGWLALLSIPLVVAARFVSVSVPILALRRWQTFTPGTIPVLTWGAVRGGISVALALSLPTEEPARALILDATYGVVLFSVVVQGLSLGAVVRRTVPTAS